MKKYNKLMILSLSMLMMIPSMIVNNENSLICSTTDVFNEKAHIEKRLLNQLADTNETVKYSNMYVQYGYDGTNYYLRYATAIKGDIETLNYKMFINDKEYTAGEKNADVLYKSILSNGTRQYYNGNELTTTPTEYLWTCYTIKFASEKHQADNIAVYLNINNENTVSKSTSLLEEMNVEPDHIEAEDCVYLLENGNKYTTSEASANAQYPDSEGKISSSNFSRINNGSSGKGAVSSLSRTQNGTKVYFEFTVNAPTSGEYELLARVQGIDESSINGLFNVSINGGEATLNTSNDKILKGNQLKDQYNASSDYLNWCNLFWWNMVNIGTYSLNKGENTIKITLPNGLNGNIDYFEIQNKNITKTSKIFSFREGSREELSTSNGLTLIENGLLSDKSDTPANHPCKYTLMYIRLLDGSEHPITEEMLTNYSNIDYTKVNQEQIVTINYKENTASFKLFIVKENYDIYEAEDNVYWYKNGEETTNKYTSVNNLTNIEYYENETLKSKQTKDGSSNKKVIALGTGASNHGKEVFFKFEVNVQETKDYYLFSRLQSANKNDLINCFEININEEKDENGKLKYYKNNYSQIPSLCNQTTTFNSLWNNAMWFGMANLGKIHLTKGNNIIRVRMPNGISANIDFFQVRETDSFGANLFTVRDGSHTKLDLLTLEKDQKITDIISTPSAHPYQYTLMYLRLPNGNEYPIVTKPSEGTNVNYVGVLSDIDYTLSSQKVTVTNGNYKLSFTLNINL